MATLSPSVPFHHPSYSYPSSSSHKHSSSFSCPLSSFRGLNPPWRKPDSYHSIFCISATKKSRSRSRKTKSDEDLRNDIKEFLSDVGLPSDHVPSTKELSAHGRQDLANIIRRRGYKFMKELLATSFETQTDSFSSEDLRGEQNILPNYQTASTGLDDIANVSSGVMSLSTEAAKLKLQEIDSVKDDSVFSEAPLVEVDETAYDEVASLTHGAAEAIVGEDKKTSSEVDAELPLEHHILSAQESSLHPSLQEKVEKFILDGELDNIEENDIALCGDEVLNGSVASSSYQVEGQEFQMYSSRIGSGSTDETKVAQKSDNQDEINRLKKLLHQKELELIQLKEQLEHEKRNLSMFQTKAQREISEVQKRISEKDAELHATEEILSGMEEVEIQFWSEGEVVEVAGSFNGWHHKIKMESQPPSSISVTTQKSRLWRTILWLYPGVYEIKFVVDGHWMVDPHRESVTKGSIHNNILRVGRG